MPRRALTAASVDRIKPPTSGQVEHFDKGFPGLALRISVRRWEKLCVLLPHRQQLRRMTLGTYPAISLAQARDAWRKARLDVAAGRDRQVVKRGDLGHQL